MSLVEESTLTTSEVPFSDNSHSSAENPPIAFEYYCYDNEAGAPWFNYHGPKNMIPKQDSSLTICTAERIGTICSWRLFRMLFDSGSNFSMIKKSALPKGIITKLLGDTKLVRTLEVALKLKKSSQCKTWYWPNLIKIGASFNNECFSVWQG